MSDFYFLTKGRIIRDKTLVDVYYEDPIPVTNITGLDTIGLPSTTSGEILVSSFPLGINIYNRDTGLIANYDLSTSGINRFTLVKNLATRDIVTVSGAADSGQR